MAHTRGTQLNAFEDTIDLVATKPTEKATSDDAQLIKNIGTTTTKDADHWSASRFNRRQAAHSIFQYPGRMVPEVQQRLIQAVKTVKPDTQTMLDPYMGSGTALVASMYHGLDCHGQDINPLAILVSRVKTTPFNAEACNALLVDVVRQARADTCLDVAVDFPGIKKWFRDDVAQELSKLRRALVDSGDEVSRRILWVTLAETIRLTSNDRTSTYKLHARPIEESSARVLDVIGTFHNLAVRNIADLINFRYDLRDAQHWLNERYPFETAVACLSSTERIMSPQGKATKFDLVVTSPPYGDNKTTIPYGEHAYLPLQWIPLEDIHSAVVANRDWLKTTGGIDRHSIGGIFKERPKETIDKLRAASPTLCGHLVSLANAEPVLRRKVVSFYDDFYRSLELISGSLTPDAYLIWTLGNRRVNKMEIKNDAILQEFMSSLGCDYVTRLERIIHSKRMPHRNRSGNTMANEQILILRKATD